MSRVILSRNWKAKGRRLPKSVLAARQRKSKRVRVVSKAKGKA